MIAPRPRYGRIRSVGTARAPGIVLAGAVASWYCDRYAAPMSGAFKSIGSLFGGTEIEPNDTEL